MALRASKSCRYGLRMSPRAAAPQFVINKAFMSRRFGAAVPGALRRPLEARLGAPFSLLFLRFSLHFSIRLDDESRFIFMRLEAFGRGTARKRWRCRR